MINRLKQLAARLRGVAGDNSAAVSPGYLKSLMPLLVVAGAITALVMLYLWRDQSTYKPLFGARENVSAADMMSVLDSAGISYRVHPESGQVLVPSDELGRARMLLASKGVIGKPPAGLELVENDDPLGVSQFVQDVRFRRGLEGELARSIMTLSAVESARVHLSLPRSSSFVMSNVEKSSASVVVTLKPGNELSREQIAAIINMVAGSVAGLDPQRVTLVDQAGDLLSARVDLSEGFESIQSNDAARYHREQTWRNARELLAPVLGEHNFKVSVTAEVDTDRVKETREQYGDTSRVTNESLREESDRGDLVALGVPGSLSNRPIDVDQEKDAGGGMAQRNATTRQYAYDRSITQIERARGRLRKLNVAVVLNSAAAPSGTGTWSAAELANIENILRSGLGIDSSRGDTLVVSALPFPKLPDPAAWWQQRETVVDIGSWALQALALLLIAFFVARPLVRVAQQRLAAPALAHAQAATEPSAANTLPGARENAAIGRETRADSPGAVSPLLDDYDLPPAGSPVDVMVDHLKVLAAKEPERVAEVVKQWVQSNVRAQ